MPPRRSARQASIRAASVASSGAEDEGVTSQARRGRRTSATPSSTVAAAGTSTTTRRPHRRTKSRADSDAEPTESDNEAGIATETDEFAPEIAPVTPARRQSRRLSATPVAASRPRNPRSRAVSEGHTLALAPLPKTPRRSNRRSQSRRLSEEPQPVMFEPLQSDLETVETTGIQTGIVEEQMEYDTVAKSHNLSTLMEVEVETEESVYYHQQEKLEEVEEEEAENDEDEAVSLIDEHEDRDESDDGSLQALGNARPEILVRNPTPSRGSSVSDTDPVDSRQSYESDGESDDGSPLERRTGVHMTLQVQVPTPSTERAAPSSSSPFGLQSQLEFNSRTDTATEDDNYVSQFPDEEDGVDGSEYEEGSSSPGLARAQLLPAQESSPEASPTDQLRVELPMSRPETDEDDTAVYDDSFAEVKIETVDRSDRSATPEYSEFQPNNHDSMVTSSPRPVSEAALSPVQELSPPEEITLDSESDISSPPRHDQPTSSPARSGALSLSPGLPITPPNEPIEENQQGSDTSTPVSSPPPSHFDQEVGFHELSPIAEVPEPPEEDDYPLDDHLTPLSSSPPSADSPPQKQRLSLFGTPTISKLVSLRTFANNSNSPTGPARKRPLDSSRYLGRDSTSVSSSGEEQDGQDSKRRRTQATASADTAYKSPIGRSNDETSQRDSGSLSSLSRFQSTPQRGQRPVTAAGPATTPESRRRQSGPTLQTPFQTPKARPAVTPFETPGGHVQVQVTEDQASWYSAFMTPIRNFFNSNPSRKIRGLTLNIIPNRKSSASGSATPTSATTFPDSIDTFDSASSASNLRPVRSWVPPHLAGETSSAGSSGNAGRVAVRDFQSGQTEHLIDQLKKLAPLQEDLDLVMDAWMNAKVMAQKAAAIDAKREGFVFVLRDQPAARTAAESDLKLSNRAYDQHLRLYEPGVVDVIRGRIKAAFQSHPDRFRWNSATDSVEPADGPRLTAGNKRSERTIIPFEDNGDGEAPADQEPEVSRPTKRTRTEPSQSVRVNVDTRPAGPSGPILRHGPESASSTGSGTSKAVRFLSPRSNSIRRTFEDSDAPSPSTPTPALRPAARTTPHPKSALARSSVVDQAGSTPFISRQVSTLKGDGRLAAIDTAKAQQHTSRDLGTPDFMGDLSDDQREQLRRTGHLLDSGVFTMPQLSDSDYDDMGDDMLADSDDEEESEEDDDDDDDDDDDEPDSPLALPAPPGERRKRQEVSFALPPPETALVVQKPVDSFNAFAAAETVEKEKAQVANDGAAPVESQSQVSAPVSMLSPPQTGETDFTALSGTPNTMMDVSPRVFEHPDYLTGRQVLGMLPSSQDADEEQEVSWPTARPVYDRDLETTESVEANEYLQHMWATVC